MSGLLLVASAWVASAQSLEIGSQLPQLRGETLTGAPLALPDAAKGKIAFLAITFSEKAGKSARPWSERFEKDHGSRSNLTNYSVSMLGGAPRIFRGMITRAIKKSVPQQSQNRFLIGTSDEAEWKKYLNVADEELPNLLLLDGDGRVIWKDHGAFEEKKYEALKAKLQAAQTK